MASARQPCPTAGQGRGPRLRMGTLVPGTPLPCFGGLQSTPGGAAQVGVPPGRGSVPASQGTPARGVRGELGVLTEGKLRLRLANSSKAPQLVNGQELVWAEAAPQEPCRGRAEPAPWRGHLYDRDLFLRIQRLQLRALLPSPPPQAPCPWTPSCQPAFRVQGGLQTHRPHRPEAASALGPPGGGGGGGPTYSRTGTVGGGEGHVPAGAGVEPSPSAPVRPPCQPVGLWLPPSPWFVCSEWSP